MIGEGINTNQLTVKFSVVKKCAHFEKCKPSMLYAILEHYINSRSYVRRRKGDFNVELGGGLLKVKLMAYFNNFLPGFLLKER
jgi:hypothetical protein